MCYVLCLSALKPRGLSLRYNTQDTTHKTLDITTQYQSLQPLPSLLKRLLKIRDHVGWVL
jgi:hypothetical protein